MALSGSFSKAELQQASILQARVQVKWALLFESPLSVQATGIRADKYS